MSAETDKIRRDFKASDDRRDAGLTTPEGIRRFDNIPYGPDGMEILDVYRPRAAGAAGSTAQRRPTSFTVWIWPCGALRW